MSLLFQFTHPGRGATEAESAPCRRIGFNSRTPGGVRLYRRQDYEGSKPVSIHAPREGCDIVSVITRELHIRFNSRTPGGVRRLVRRAEW